MKDVEENRTGCFNLTTTFNHTNTHGKNPMVEKDHEDHPLWKEHG